MSLSQQQEMHTDFGDLTISAAKYDVHLLVQIQQEELFAGGTVEVILI